MQKKDSRVTPFWQGNVLVEERDIFSDLAERKGTSLFLSRYSMTEVHAVLGKKNFFKEAGKRGLWPLEFDLDSSEYPLQRLRIFYQKKKPENLIVDLKIKEGTFSPDRHGLPRFPDIPGKYLVFEWLTLQNPRLRFSEERSPLPGQVNPGLNLGRKVMDIFVYLGMLTHKDGLLAFPAYFHNALLFSRYFHFVNPEKQGEVLAIRKSFSDIPLKKLAWIVHLNCLRAGDGRAYEWKAEEQIYPLNKALKGYFDSKKYRKRIKLGQKKFSFTIDWDEYGKKAKKERLKEMGL